MSKKQRGRPKLKRTEQKSKVLQVRLTQAEYKTLENQAQRDESPSVSAWARIVLLKAVI